MVLQLVGGWAALVYKSDLDLIDEMVFADVERLRPRMVRALGAGVTVTAAVGRTPVVPGLSSGVARIPQDDGDDA